MKFNLLDPHTRHSLITWYDTITKQNYLTNKGNIIIQKDGLAMGAPSSSILSEIFLQYTVASHIASIAKKHMIINYFWYTDDIIFIFDSTQTNTQSILTDFNSIHPNLHFTTETEQNNTNYVDISIYKTEHNIQISTCRKPTFTDTIIPYTFNHPTQHKYAAIRYLCNGLHTYQLNNDNTIIIYTLPKCNIVVIFFHILMKYLMFTDYINSPRKHTCNTHTSFLRPE